MRKNLRSSITRKSIYKVARARRRVTPLSTQWMLSDKQHGGGLRHVYCAFDPIGPASPHVNAGATAFPTTSTLVYQGRRYQHQIAYIWLYVVIKCTLA